MTIKIAERFRPFTHVPGARFILPGGKGEFCVYPTKVIFGGEEKSLPIDGIVENFTVLHDLEREEVVLSGRATGKFFRYFINGSHELSLKSFPVSNVDKERLSFGCTKSQNFEKIKERGELAEFLPLWFFAGQFFKDITYAPRQSLLDELKKSILSRDTIAISRYFKDLFQIGFSSIFYPLREDVSFYGGKYPPISKGEDPIALLGIGYQLIRRCIVEEGEGVTLLPLPLMPSGRLLDAKISFGKISLEWTKGRLRKVDLQATKDECVTFNFPKELKSARLNHERELLLPKVKLQLKAGKKYFFDHFIS